MAYIEQFTITGLANNRGPIHRILDRHVNLFWGLNGTGKTSLLKILHSALRNESSILKRLHFESAEVIFWSTDHQALIRRWVVKDPVDSDDPDDEPQMGLEQVGDGLWREVPLKNSTAWVTEVIEGRVPRTDAPFEHSYLPISRLSEGPGGPGNGRPRTTASRSFVDDSYLDDHFASQVKRKWHRYNADALVQIRQIQQQGLASILAHLFGGGTGPKMGSNVELLPNEAYSMVRAFLKEQRISLRFGRNEFMRRYDEQSDLRGVVANIQDVMAEVDEALRPQWEFMQVVNDLFSGGKELRLDSVADDIEIRVEGSEIPLTSLSSGEKQLLRLLLEVLAAGEATVMIDEPELSLHVDWQLDLVASLRKVNPECQLLLATHSPEVMAEVPDRYVFEL